MLMAFCDEYEVWLQFLRVCIIWNTKQNAEGDAGVLVDIIQ
jgi:hypothetical protein